MEQQEWYEVKVKSESIAEDGLLKTKTENYLVDADSFAEAEQRVIESEYAPYNSPYEVKACAIRKYQDIVRFSPKEVEASYFKCKVSLITLDEKSGKEKQSTINILIQSLDFVNAVIGIRDYLKKGFTDFAIESVQRTKIVKLIPYAA